MADFKCFGFIQLAFSSLALLFAVAACTPGGNSEDPVQLVTSISLDKTSLRLIIGDEVTLTVISVIPDNASDKTFSWSSSDNAIASVDKSGKVTAKSKGNATIQATANDGSGVFASCSVDVKNPCPSRAVDLGLSVYWATSNLSTNVFCAYPQDYGDYYAWGEIEPKAHYSWETYKLCDGSRSTLTKYNTSTSCGTVDNKTSFKDYDYDDDAARKQLLNNWRIPTDAEWTELRENCTWTWTADYNGTGVAGRIVTSNVDGYKDKSIFLPAAGRRVDSSVSAAGNHGYYWSSSLSTDDPVKAWNVDFSFGNVFRSGYGRSDGFSIRPVAD